MMIWLLNLKCIFSVFILNTSAAFDMNHFLLEILSFLLWPYLLNHLPSMDSLKGSILNVAVPWSFILGALFYTPLWFKTNTHPKIHVFISDLSPAFQTYIANYLHLSISLVPQIQVFKTELNNSCQTYSLNISQMCLLSVMLSLPLFKLSYPAFILKTILR